MIIGDPVDLTVSWTVKNVGAGPGRVNTWTDRVILSNDDILGDADDIVLGSYPHFGFTPVDAEYSRTEIIQLANRTNGRFTLFVQTDANDDVFELADDASNVGSPAHFVDVSQTPFSDLVVDSVSTAGDPTSGQPIEVTWTVRNNDDRGIATTDRDSWTDYIYISPDPTGATGLKLIGSSTHGGALSLGGSYTRTDNFVLPRTTDGEHYVFVRTAGPYEFIHNSNAPLADGGGGNQARSEAIDVFLVPPPNADLVVTDVSIGGATEFVDGTQVEVTWTVENQGETTETGWRDKLFLQSTGGSETYQFGKYTVDESLEAGKSITRTEVVLLPRTTGPVSILCRYGHRRCDFRNRQRAEHRFQRSISNQFETATRLASHRRPATTRLRSRPARSRCRVSTFETWGPPIRRRPAAAGKIAFGCRPPPVAPPGALLLGELDNGSALGFPGITQRACPTEYVTTGQFPDPTSDFGQLVRVGRNRRTRSSR